MLCINVKRNSGHVVIHSCFLPDENKRRFFKKKIRKKTPSTYKQFARQHVLIFLLFRLYSKVFGEKAGEATSQLTISRWAAAKVSSFTLAAAFMIHFCTGLSRLQGKYVCQFSQFIVKKIDIY